MGEVAHSGSSSTSRAFWAAFVILLALSEAAARLVYPWALRHGPEGYLSSAAYVRDLFTLARDSDSVVLMGDSILGSSALREHHANDPSQHQLSALLRASLASSHTSVVTVAADGMLPADMVGALRLAPAGMTAPLIVVLNVRMFAPDFQLAGRDTFFPFLKDGYMSTSGGLFRMSEDELSSWLFSEATERSTLLRTLYQLRGLWFSPNPQAAYQILIERIFGDPADSDLKQAILRSRVESFYAPRPWRESDPQVSGLLKLVRTATSQGSRVLVVIAPQNPEFFPSEEAALQLRSNAASLGTLVKGIKGAQFISLLDSYPPEYFLDHCHLSPQGNQKLAQALAEQMEGPL